MSSPIISTESSRAISSCSASFKAPSIVSSRALILPGSTLRRRHHRPCCLGIGDSSANRTASSNLPLDLGTDFRQSLRGLDAALNHLGNECGDGIATAPRLSSSAGRSSDVLL